MAKAFAAYTMLSAMWRLRLADASTFVAYAGCIVGFVAWWLLLPPVRVADLSLISSALAADQGALISGIDPKIVINIAIFIALLVIFLASFLLAAFSKNEKAVDAGATTAKTLIGFFIGAGTKYLGI